MTVICDACATENRDRAMFCRGCANKLPAFAPTGTSALETLGVRRSSKSGAAPFFDGSSPASGALFEPASVRRWIAILVLFTAAVLAVVAWFAFGRHDTAMAPTQPLAENRLPAETSLAPNETLEKPERSQESPIEGSAASTAAAAASEAVTAPAPAPTTTQPATAEPASPGASPVVTPQRSPSPVKRAAANASGTRAADPRVGCDHLFFAFAARCEANHCQQAAYARHPRCDAVREQRRLDEARRNSLPSN